MDKIIKTLRSEFLQDTVFTYPGKLTGIRLLLVYSGAFSNISTVSVTAVVKRGIIIIQPACGFHLNHCQSLYVYCSHKPSLSYFRINKVQNEFVEWTNISLSLFVSSVAYTVCLVEPYWTSTQAQLKIKTIASIF